MRKKRGYKRDTEAPLLRDYKLFAIACEGGKREPNYFSALKNISTRIAIDIIEDIVPDDEMADANVHKSAPRWVLNRAVKYIEKEGLSNEDDLWFVMDIDRWETAQLREIAAYCEQHSNWHIVLSNPCFEVWLYFHKRNSIEGTNMSCNQFKYEISTHTTGGYHPLEYLSEFQIAINNSKTNDSSPDYFLPNLNETKVYQLGETIIEFIGDNAFQNFITITLPKLLLKARQRRKN